MIYKDAPVICAECDKVEIHGRDLFCTEKKRKCYGARPSWCPRPLWDDDVIEGQLSIFDFIGERHEDND